MNEFIYSINEVFTPEKLLENNNVTQYYIAPYQRGYKWASKNKYDQVPQMLIDIYDAYKNKIEEYYLQYITVKKNKIKEQEIVYEVIDGQQRLTTLSLFFYTANKFHNIDNITHNKVCYSRYNYDNIFENIMDYINENIDPEKAEEQDKYYMLKAALCIKNFLSSLNQKNKLEEYINYLNSKVKLIVNFESEFVSSEDVFSNLNDNKVPLSSSELIKGLLLTLGARTDNNNLLKKHYKEILDQRAIMGRLWDEIFTWIEQKKVCNYFFGVETNGMEHLLSLINLTTPKVNNHEEIIDFINSLEAENVKNKSENHLFDSFNDAISTYQDANTVLKDLKHIYLTLKGVYENYEDPAMYNHLGYVFFAKKQNKTMSLNDRKEFLKKFINQSNEEKWKAVKDKIKNLLPSIKGMQKDNSDNYPELAYKSRNDKLTNLLLSFSVFPEEIYSKYRFDFYRYDNENWSFEHIFPQNPKQYVKIAHESKELVITKIKQYYSDNDQNKATKLINDIINNISIEIENNLDFLYETDFDIDCVGNMALLSGGVNSALSNNPFIAKRPILSKKINEGYFVPKHTIDVFYKSINNSSSAFNMDLTIWEKEDVKAHISWMEQRNEEILNKMI